MDSDPINWYPEPVPMWNLQTPTIFVPPSSTLVNPPLSPPPHSALQSNRFQLSSHPQSLLAFLIQRQRKFAMLLLFFSKDRSHLIQELRTKVPTATTAATTIQYAPEDPTLPSPWRGLIDGSLGSLYYWNPETNQTHHCYITLKATAESEFLIVSGTPPITVHQPRAPLLKFERQLHYEIIDFVVLANDYSKLAFFSADCSPFPHENYRQHCSLWNSILGKVTVCDCWSCALLFAAPYDTLVAQIKNGALYCIDTILQSFPDIVRDNKRSVLVDVGGATLLMVELNRVLRVRGSFVRSAIPAYHKFHADIGIRGAISLRSLMDFDPIRYPAEVKFWFHGNS
ncbi:hypothetical protein ACLB2K_064350 [Fragaria x ananassa]